MRFFAVIDSVCLATILGTSAVEAQRSGLTLVPVDSVRLEESDASFIASISGFTVSGAGRFYVSDKGNSVVHEFANNGRRLRAFGRRGQGPGEFVVPTAMAVSGDSILIVNGNASLQAFDLRSGRHVWQRTVPRVTRADVIISRGGWLYFPSFDPLRHTSVGRISGASDSVAYSGPFPAPYGRNEIVDGAFSRLSVAVAGNDSIVTAFQASDFVFIGRFGRAEYDSVHIPRIGRNGAHPSVMMKPGLDVAALQPYVYALSMPFALGILRSSHVAVVHIDQTLLNGRVAGSLFVSVVNLRTKKACADAPVPLPSDPPAWPAFRGDTLLLVQQGEARSGQPEVVVRKYTIGTTNCRWE
jgi:hypothetical protein